MKNKFGFELIVEQVMGATQARVTAMAASFQMSPKTGDSPIEKLLYLSVYLYSLLADTGTRWDLVTYGKLDELKERQDFRDLLIMERQAQIDGIGRVDFLFHAYGDWPREPDGGKEGWRRLIIECDGHDFHERTKKQAANDRSRDRAAIMAGFEVFRFTGSEIWRDPWGCAGQIIAWADKAV